MAPHSSPRTPRSVRLGRGLAALRDAEGLTMETVAGRLGRSAPWLSRVESGEIRVSEAHTVALLDLYGVPKDSEIRAALLDIAHGLFKAGWWEPLDRLSGRYKTYIAYEEEATDVYNYEPILIPGLLQIPAYVTAVHSGTPDEASASQRIKTRLRRQAVLSREPNPLRLHAILGESALHLEVGGRRVLSEQLTHVAELADWPTITIQVLPFTAGERVTVLGGFAVLTFAENDPPLGYVETAAGELFLESAKDVGRLGKSFERLTALAMSPTESLQYLKELAA